MKKAIKSFKSLALIMCCLFYLIGANAQMINTNPSGTITSGICGNAQEYQKVFETLKEKGFRPTKVSAKWATMIEDYPPPYFEYSATFQKETNASAWVARHVLSLEQYKKELDIWTQKGYMPTDINVATSKAGVINYTLIMEKINNPPLWQERHGLHDFDLAQADKELIALGYKRTITTQTPKGVFAALWTKPSRTYVKKNLDLHELKKN